MVVLCNAKLYTNIDNNKIIIVTNKNKQESLPCVLCGRRRIKPIHKYTSMGMTTIEHISEGMCRQCAWERITITCPKSSNR